MTAQPIWSDSGQGDLLALVAMGTAGVSDHEWSLFEDALYRAADHEGIIRPNTLRPLVRGRIAPRRISAFTSKALAAGIIAYTGEWQVSDDHEGRNAGKPQRIMRLVGGLS